ncbi:hypothetical protein ACPPVT_05425 [Angustibacter sp. McL0619]|uniref:hypothetical protein n=1 Tax=Angustibacter sp. McL0619 TaxID=3415676 RepID=UPI003CF4770F
MLADRATSETARAVRWPALAAIVAALAALLAALVVATAALLGTVTHQLTYRVAGVRAPVGLAMAVALTALVAVLLRELRASLLTRAAAAAGWLVAIAAVLRTSPGGDVLVPANLRGYGWLLGGFLVLLVVLVLPGRDRRATRG